MMKLDALIVVEGVTDVQFLSTFIDAEFITTNGSDVPRETIQYIKTMSNIKDVIVLTDPDSPGKRIRDVLNANINNLKHVYVEKKYCQKKHKVGVAEATKEHVIEALKNVVVEKSLNNQGTLNISNLYDLGLCGQKESFERRKKLMENMHIGFGNAKTLLKRLNSINCSFEELEKEVKKVNE